MDLNEALRKQKEAFLKAVPEEVAATMNDATEELAQSEILTGCLKVGEQIEDFSLRNADNSGISLYNTLKGGPVILKFFRGDW